MKTLLCGAFLLSMAFTPAFGQAALPPSDPIRGVWKLDLDKSKNTNPLPDNEIITIARQDTSFKLTFDVTQSNGYNPKYDIITEMKGDAVKPVNANGKGTSDSWRVTRRGRNGFDMELSSAFGGWTDKYEVSSDGKTMTLRRVESNGRVAGAYVEKDGTLRRNPQYVLVFDRVE